MYIHTHLCVCAAISLSLHLTLFQFWGLRNHTAPWVRFQRDNSKGLMQFMKDPAWKPNPIRVIRWDSQNSLHTFPNKKHANICFLTCLNTLFPFATGSCPDMSLLKTRSKIGELIHVTLLLVVQPPRVNLTFTTFIPHLLWLPWLWSL